MRYEIIIYTDLGTFYLDTTSEEGVELNYSIADIQDISSRNSSYSRTITLPATLNNRDVFGNICDLSIDSTFNPNKKSKCQILLDTLVILDGYLQMKNVKLDDIKGDTFEVVVFAENDNFFTEIGDGFITDMDWTGYNHIFGTTSVIDSWHADYNNGFYYPLIDYGFNWDYSDVSGTGATSTTVNLNEIFPSTYARTIWDKIFYDAGYTYTSNFINNNPSSVFNQLVIPFNNNKLLAVGQEDPNYLFKVGVPGTQTMSCTELELIGQVGNKAGITTRYWRQYGYTILEFTNESSPYNDPSSQWNTTEFTQTFPTLIQRYGVVLSWDGNISSLLAPSPGIPGGVGTWLIQPYDPWILIAAYRQYNPDGTLNSGWASGTGYFVSESSDFIGHTTGNYVTPFFDGSTPALTPLYPGEKLRFRMSANVIGITVFTQSARYQIGSVMSTILDGYVYNEIDSTQLLPGQTLDYVTSVPKQTKKKDFILSIAKMFNLYIDSDPNNNRNLIIEPRDNYYELGSGIPKDWTDKIDLNEVIQEGIISDLTNRQILLTYKEDKDYYNSYYKGVFNEVYGQYLYDTGNEFAKGIKKIEPIFSPTPLKLVTNSSSLVVPSISKDSLNHNDGNVPRDNYNIRILRRYTDTLPLPNNELFSFEGIQYSYYPYAGHFDNPYTPDNDINFGILQKSFIPISQYTGNNLFNLYYSNFFDEIYGNKSRIITVRMYLTSEDINNFRFYDIISLYINGSYQYYRINKITGFNPLYESTCSVELIKILELNGSNRQLDGISNNGSTGFPFGISNLTNLSTSSRNNLIGVRNLVTGKGNFVSDDTSSIIGNVNSSQNGTKTLTIGDSNNLLSNKNGIINGDSNSINISNNFNINGSGTIATMSNSLNIVGDNNKLNSSSTINLIGASNSIQLGGMSSIIGDSNIVSNSIYVRLTGLDNIISDSSNITVFGDNNQVIGSSSNVFYVGSNGFISGKSDSFIVNNESYFNSPVTFNSNVTINGSNNSSISESTIGVQSKYIEIIGYTMSSIFGKIITIASDKTNNYSYSVELSLLLDNSNNVIDSHKVSQFTSYPSSQPTFSLVTATSSLYMLISGATGSNIDWKISLNTYEI